MNKSGYLTILLFSTTLIVLIASVKCLPVPEDKDEDDKSKNESSSSKSSASSPSPALKVVADEIKDDDKKSTSNDELAPAESKQKREQRLPSNDDLEGRREEFIKSLGGRGEGSAVLTSLMGLGSLATDAVTLLSQNANETFAPLREARQRARESFPDFGTNLNRFIKNGREYTSRAYRGLVKNLRVKLTNTIRFMLQFVTRFASTIGGLYQVLVSVLDVVTRGVTAGAPVVSRLLSRGSTAAIRGLARGTEIAKSIANSGAISKPLNQALTVGREVSMGITEDLFDKVEWAQEGINSKLELAQALAPNFLLRAHENVAATKPEGGSSSSGDSDTISIDGGGGSSSNGGYSKLHDEEDDAPVDEGFLGLSASATEEKMQRDGREIVKEMMEKMQDKSSSSSTTSSTTTTTTTTEIPKKEVDKSTTEVNQSLLDDIFGLQGEADKIKSMTEKSKDEEKKER